jgi:YD repeat-containing protein
MRRSSLKVFLITSVILLLMGPGAQAQQIRYVYDDLGRLIAVIDQQGRTAIYEYDAVGNILAIRRPDTTGPVAITFFNPKRGPVGTRVEIFGVGFSDVPAQNQIAFNGVSAPTLAASVTALTTQVPDGATTGPISVTTPLGSAVSAEPFTVIGRLAVSPVEATLVIGSSLQFTATVTGAEDQRVFWSVNSVEGGNAAVGTITPEGLYNAPATVPIPATVTVRATSVPFPEAFGEATVTIVSEATGFAQAAVSVHFGPPPRGTIGAPPVSVGFGPPPSGTVIGLPVSVAFGPPPPATIISQAVSVANAPVIASVAPNTASQGSTFLITLTGVNFAGATGVVFSFQGRADTNITATSINISPAGDQLTADVTISASALVGDRIVIIQTLAGTSTGAPTGNNGFTITAP